MKTYTKGLPVVCLAAALLVSACGSSITNKNRELYDGVAFKAKAKPVDKKIDPEVFEIEIKDVDRSPKGAREAAAHAGTKYCVTTFGSSKIAWANDPRDEEQPLTVADGRALFQGTCTP